MKTIGLLGGTSWESTQGYYKAINEGVKNHLGGLHSAKIAMVSVDFAEIEALQMQDNWQQAGEILASAAVSVEAAGARSQSSPGITGQRRLAARKREFQELVSTRSASPTALVALSRLA